MTAHYIACGGMHGCMTNFSYTCDSYDGAIDVIVSIHELGKRRAAELRRDGYIELNLHRDGNEYAEVIECECDNPDEHSDDC